MMPRFAATQWSSLQAKADLPEAQEAIRRAIFKGIIRVVPGPGDGIRIIPSEQGTWRTSAILFGDPTAIPDGHVVAVLSGSGTETLLASGTFLPSRSEG